MGAIKWETILEASVYLVFYLVQIKLIDSPKTLRIFSCVRNSYNTNARQDYFKLANFSPTIYKALLNITMTRIKWAEAHRIDVLLRIAGTRTLHLHNPILHLMTFRQI